MRRGIYGGHHKNTCPLEGGLKIKILKANGRAKDKEMCLKEQQIYQSNCLEFTWDFYAEQISMSVKSAGPIAWTWKRIELNFPLLF